jgi:hypothetical protein
MKDNLLGAAAATDTPASAAAILLTRPVLLTANTSRLLSADLNCTSRIKPFVANSPVFTFFAINLPFTLTASNTFIILSFIKLCLGLIPYCYT